MEPTLPRSAAAAAATNMQETTVRFRMRRASGTAFQVDIVPRAALPLSLRRLRVRVEEMTLLGESEICISKRLRLAEVERMIACCRQHVRELMLMLMLERNAID
ncbi:hypothetical protein ATCC90586_002510 [Pythium insidiosum]|nr:hypothetical protein ATCC90586_002510 [Pythium insidiosum]